MKINRAAVLSIFLWASIGLGNATAQFVEFGPLHRIKAKPSSLSGANSRITETLSIPFWEDFSKGIDTLKWAPEGASYTETIGINPPSIGMLLLNGVDENGRPYSFVNIDQGVTDQFTSKTIDLSGIPSAEQNSLFLSFFWQAGGRAEYPDEGDQLSLQVQNEEGSWITIWFVRGSADHPREEFTQAFVPILPELQHAEFKFRFVARGRQSGPFDSWLVDYIYLNTNRNPEETDYPDRSLTVPNRLRLGDFGAYPLELLASNQERIWSLVSNEFQNLEDRFRAMEYSIQISDPESGIVLPINTNTPFNPVPNALERRKFESLPFDEIPVPQLETDLILKTTLLSGDDLLFESIGGDTTRFESVDFRENDTVKTTFPIRDFFAYDNGSADYSAGINQRAGQLAVEYNTPEEVYLKGISINFTNPNQGEQAIDILVWKELDQAPIFRREDLIPRFPTSDSLVYFSLDTNIVVSGTFYVGYAQFTDDFVYVGLDKLNDTGEKIFYNVSQTWVQNEEVSGSILIRPHVTLATPFVENELPEENLRVFPNPVRNKLEVEGAFSEVRIFDPFGREIFLEREQGQKGEIINFNGQRPGIYILQVLTEAGLQTHRILVN
ncbi:T9SS type A sorting domain-containing protein [Algoriphagus namhaensis]|uniref:T9SS type A sorting domain-containing protein n=1 Tax=Algoriphagus namhaensis TaxID=915353 RepID=A0ABV8AXN3_9BACT